MGAKVGLRSKTQLTGWHTNNTNNRPLFGLTVTLLAMNT